MGREVATWWPLVSTKGLLKRQPSDAKTAKVCNSPYYHISVGEISVAQLNPLDLQKLLLLLASTSYDPGFECNVSGHNIRIEGARKRVGSLNVSRTRGEGRLATA